MSTDIFVPSEIHVHVLIFSNKSNVSFQSDSSFYFQILAILSNDKMLNNAFECILTKKHPSYLNKAMISNEEIKLSLKLKENNKAYLLMLIFKQINTLKRPLILAIDNIQMSPRLH